MLLLWSRDFFADDLFSFCFFLGVLLQVCGKSQETCCGENSEPQLVTVGRNLYDDKLQTSLKTLSIMYKEKAAKFDGNCFFVFISMRESWVPYINSRLQQGLSELCRVRTRVQYRHNKVFFYLALIRNSKTRCVTPVRFNIRLQIALVHNIYYL